MYHWIKPEILIPVHGESRHLHEHRRFALEEGIPKSLVQENGDVVRLAPNGPKKVGQERVGRLILDGDVILTADGSTMNQRRKIASFGIISVALALDGNGRLRGDPQIALEGHSRRRGSRGLHRRSCRCRRGSSPKRRRDARKAEGVDPPRRPPLRDRVDRQEARHRRADRPRLTS
jgi:mRNA degradation ribonuclease J1/J2